MARILHRWPGLLALALVTILGLSGAALSVFPAAERITAPRADAGLSVATLAARIQAAHPSVEQIKRSPSGRITAYWFDDSGAGSAVIDPATGAAHAPVGSGRTERWLTNLHRALFLDDAGRIAMAAGAAALLVLAASGAALVARRMGGWRHWFARARGPLSGRLHVEIARVTLGGLVLSAATALWMTASTFGLLPDAAGPPAFPDAVSGMTGASLGAMPILRDTPVTALRELSFPFTDDASDVFTLTTDRGTGYIDQGTGALLAWADLSGWARLSETVYMLHTGQGAAVLGVVLGLMALGLPAMAATGVLIWLAGRRGRPRIEGNQAAARADTIVLVGSEGGTTWGFAATLHAALRAAGQRVYIAPMSSYAPDLYTRARRVIVLTATYGDGAAPASARGFLDRLGARGVARGTRIAVLGFGDRGFPGFCAFAHDVADAARAQGWAELTAMHTVNRQSPQDFARWGRALGDALGIQLELSHRPVQPKTTTLTLVSRRDYGAEVQAPAAILRFALPRASLWQRLRGGGFARFQAGDLVGILPEGSTVPRLYSLASGRRDGFAEIVVAKHPGGLCSGQLTALKPGDTVTAFLRRNPGFHPGRGRAPLILIGAGTGIGPLAGFIGANRLRRPVHLFFGMRHADSDFFYGDALPGWQAAGKVTRVVTAQSRVSQPRYVQDALRGEAAQVAQAIRDGARVMVCGGRGMATGVADALDEILAPTGLTAATLKAKGRYVEDVY